MCLLFDQEGLKAWVNRSIRPSGSAGLTGLDEAERNFCLLEVVCVLSSRLGRPFDLQGCNILNHFARVEKVMHDVMRIEMHVAWHNFGQAGCHEMARAISTC